MEISFTTWGLLVLSMASGLVAGVFLAFSDFVMRSLGATQPAGGAEAMQIINREVFRTLFMILLIGLIPVTGALAVYAGVALEGPLGVVLFAGGLLYVFGVFAVSVIGNIPMNNRLEGMPQAGPQAQAYFPAYVRGWTRWNHLRWVTGAGAALCYGVGAVLTAAG